MVPPYEFLTREGCIPAQGITKGTYAETISKAREMLLIYSRADRHHPISQIQSESKVLHQNHLDHMEESLQRMTEQLAAIRTCRDDTR